MSRFESHATPIAGCFEIDCESSSDNRGRFVKTFQSGVLHELGLREDWKEEYYSISARNVVRGMHFQTPPKQYAKLVYCLCGAVLDVVLDLRKASPTYGRAVGFELSARKANMIYMSEGLAHGFVSLSDDTIMQYKVTSVYAPANDQGVLWSSFGFDWPIAQPVISQRDLLHPPLAEFETPF
jgi:dTDP-4-dehydrorhamnose 3,5-epimerase